ncbi:hypothetical protein EHQ61_08630 [Leptospira wolffii]|uniref:hypothetical protein n=1 Tax=Leptospira wolffii TaxID=409998 RepID=UPI001082EFAD|nr:hypothetical protein [Leptospira wolffii]TGL50815.1 hypothetical protein EHQ61_08630 [Leptospira wolffii]
MKNNNPNQSRQIEITWKEYKKYEEAKDQYKIVYLFVRNGKPHYIGMCNFSVFGGIRRKIGGRERSPRYGHSYEYLICAALDLAGLKLYIGKVKKSSEHLLDPIEKTLILKYLPESNKRKTKVQENFTFKHMGDFPKFLK